MSHKKAGSIKKAKRTQERTKKTPEEQLVELGDQYPHLTFQLEESMFKVEWLEKSQIEQEKSEESLQAWFYDFNHLSFVLLNTNGLRNVQRIGPYKAMIIDNTIFASIASSSFYKRSVGQPATFIMNMAGIQFDVRIIDADHDVVSTLTYVSNETTIDSLTPSILASYDVAVKKRKKESSKEYVVEEKDIFQARDFDTQVRCAVLASILGSFESDESMGVRDTITFRHPDRNITEGFSLPFNWSSIPSSCFKESGYIEITPRKMDSDTLNRPFEIIRSALFDYYYHTNDLYKVPTFGFREFELDMESDILLPSETTFKSINPMFEQYLITAESSALPSFQFLSFYHIMEFLFEKTTHRQTAEDIRSIVTRPDFLTKKEHYTARILRLVEDRTSRGESELQKLRRVFDSMLAAEFLKDFEERFRNQLETKYTLTGGHILEPVNFPDSKHFSEETRRKIGRMSKVEKSDFQRKELLDSFSERIYHLRCSIVHSNPDFPGKAKPVILDDETLEILEKEIEAIRRVAIEIVSQATARGIA
ncbi:MAG: hypothetical protein ACXABY_03415 [Candidatus Thorarchaeota archaeon]|jgi:hypothetical protein